LRLSFTLRARELCQHIEELAVHLLDAEGFVGGALDPLLKQAKVRGAKRFVRLAEQSSEHARVRPADLFHHAVHIELAQFERERIRRCGFQMMTFVNVEMRILGQDFAPRGDIRKQERMVDNKHVRGL